MEDSEIQEVAPVFDEGEKSRVVEGGVLAMNFVRKVAMGKKVDEKRYGFNGDFVKAIHARVLARSDVGGRLREESVGVDGLDAVSYHEVPSRFYLFSNWLENQMRNVTNDPDNIILAISVAAGAHYGLTQPELHPFPMGNGRTARALVNAILMHSADELRLYRVALPPVPILRSHSEEQDEKYIKALRNVRTTGTLNPLMTFIAKRWGENLGNLIGQIGRDLGQPRNEADKSLIETLNRRRQRLAQFVDADKAKFTIYPVPNYFETRWSR